MSGVPIALLVADLEERLDTYLALRFQAAVLRGRLKGAEIEIKATRKFMVERGYDPDELVTGAIPAQEEPAAPDEAPTTPAPRGLV